MVHTSNCSRRLQGLSEPQHGEDVPEFKHNLEPGEFC